VNGVVIEMKGDRFIGAQEVVAQDSRAHSFSEIEMTETDPNAHYDSDDQLPGTPTAGAGGERRARRSTAHTQAFRAIKARHSGERSRMEIFATWLTEFASSTGFFVFHVISFTTWIVWNLGILGVPQFDPFPSRRRSPKRCTW
jgi:hypothetical protein